MTPAGTFDPVWGLMVLYTVAEVVIVMLLVMPMPSNKIRGNIQKAISDLWHSQDYVKKTAWVLLTLDAFYFYDAVRNLWTHNKIVAASCESHQMRLFFQRNALITGGSAFLFFVMRRLLDIQGQLYTMRALAKEAAAAQQQLLDNGSAGSDNGKLSGGAAGGDSTLQQRQRQRQLTHTLSRMARSSQDGEAAKQD